MKNIACYIMSGILAAAMLPFMMLNVSADEDDEESYYYEESVDDSSEDGSESSYEEESSYDESSYEEESSFDESSYEEESSFDESSYEEESSFDESSYEEESSFDESSYEEESSFDESSYEEESSFDESGYEENSFDESSYEENSNNESSYEEDSKPDSGEEESSVPEEIVIMTYIPKNDPLSWLTTIETVIPSEKSSDPEHSEDEHNEPAPVTEESAPYEAGIIDTDTDAEISSIAVKTFTRTATVENTGNDSKTVFLIGLMIFSLIGMIATLALIAFMRSRGIFAPSFLRFEPKGR